jgi:hypothetical protein
MDMPKPDTKVRVKVMSSEKGKRLFPNGAIAYVSSYKDSYYDFRIAVNKYPGNDGGYWCTEWEALEGIDGMSDQDKQELTDLALAAATRRGYCNETKNILADIGLPTTPTAETKTVRVDITYTVRDGHDFETELLKYDGFVNGTRVLELLSAKKTWVSTPDTTEW